MRGIDSFRQPRIVREAERILRNEATAIRFEERVRLCGFGVLFAFDGQVQIVTIESLFEDKTEDEL